MYIQLLCLVFVYCVGQAGAFELGWSNWTSCSVSCGRGFKTKIRICISSKCPAKILSQTFVGRCYKDCSFLKHGNRTSTHKPITISTNTRTPSSYGELKTINKTNTENIYSENNRMERSTDSISNRKNNRNRTTNKNMGDKNTKHDKRDELDEKDKRDKSLKEMNISTTSNPTYVNLSKTRRLNFTLRTQLKFPKFILNTKATTVTTKPPTRYFAKTTGLETKPTVSKNLISRSIGNNINIPWNSYNKGSSNDSTKLCLSEQHDGIWWPETPVTQTAVRPCSTLNSEDSASRRCLQQGKKPKWSKVNLTKCGSQAFLAIKAKLNTLETCNSFNNAMQACSNLSYNNILKSLLNETAIKANKAILQGKDLVIAIESMAIIHNRSKSSNFIQTNRDLLHVASNLLAVRNIPTWDQVHKAQKRKLALEIVTLVDDVGFSMATRMTDKSNELMLIPAPNIGMKVVYINKFTQLRTKTISFEFNNTSINIPTQVFNETTQLVTVIYPTLSHVLFLPRDQPLSTKMTSAEELISSTVIVSSSVLPRKRRNLAAPLKMVLKNLQYYSNNTKVACVSWTPGTSQRSWSSDGCHVIYEESDSLATTCICNHMTLFAAIMDPYGTRIPDDHRVGLEIIASIGCSISLIAIFSTFVITLIHWKKLKSPRSEILLNMCLSIGAVCVLVLVEKPARDNQIACPLVATLLHYFLLSVFAWMLCEGFLLRMLFFSDITGSGRSKIKQFYLFGWGFPVLIVSVSVGVTQFHGYGELQVLCWLSTNNGLTWAFVAPAVLVVLVNSWILVLIMKRMLRIRHIKTKPRAQRIRLGVRATLVILPLLGITWLFGLLAFNSDTIAFKYLFTVFNSLQGVMIFVFHCILDNKVKEALSSRQRRGRRRKSAELSVTKVRPHGKEDSNDIDSPCAPGKIFSFSKSSIKRDLGKKWDNLWAKRKQKRVARIAPHNKEQDKGKQSSSFHMESLELHNQSGV